MNHENSVPVNWSKFIKSGEALHTASALVDASVLSLAAQDSDPVLEGVIKLLLMAQSALRVHESELERE